ncbi:MAG: hypothetical protein F6J87_18460, partial [Spirulina sp. SIO3F2]|nr:hypothetical protein [Spirulina sp. SIO3F2]
MKEKNRVMGSVQQWCCAAIVGSGWTMAMGLSPSAIASPELTVDKSAKPIAPSPSDTALTSS